MLKCWVGYNVVDDDVKESQAVKQLRQMVIDLVEYKSVTLFMMRPLMTT